ncbi:MAG: nicotinate phosphoribosyltransferase, partial [Endomicrobia bacterium]|nr:nicotinate phosphoribosyltransferase [Endomicrobiia bacterium]
KPERIKKVMKNVLLKQIVNKGKLVYRFPSIEQIKLKTKKNLKMLPAEYKRLINPHIYPVGIDIKLKRLKEQMLYKQRNSK